LAAQVDQDGPNWKPPERFRHGLTENNSVVHRPLILVAAAAGTHRPLMARRLQRCSVSAGFRL